MQTKRKHLEAVECNGFIYAIGGKQGNHQKSRLKNVEKYDPNSNTWTYVCDLRIERSALSACVVDGKIYAIGGFSADGNIVKIIECYNPLTDSWSIVVEASEKLVYHSVVAV